MLKSIKVRDCMPRHPLSFRADTDLMRAIELLLEHRLSAAAVVDEHGVLIGLLSEGDCLRGMLSGSYYDAVGSPARGSVRKRISSKWRNALSTAVDIDCRWSRMAVCWGWSAAMMCCAQSRLSPSAMGVRVGLFG